MSLLFLLTISESRCVLKFFFLLFKKNLCSHNINSKTSVQVNEGNSQCGYTEKCGIQKTWLGVSQLIIFS